MKKIKYTEFELENFNRIGHFLLLSFSDGSSILIADVLEEFNLENFEFIIEEYTTKAASRAGGVLNFPDTIRVTSTSSGTSNYPPNQKFVKATRRKTYQERIYIANYNGNIPHVGTQGTSGGGKTYTYTGSIPYRNHFQVQP